METEKDILKGDNTVDEQLSRLVKDEYFDIKKEKLDLKSALRVVEELILKEEVGPSTRPSEIRDIIASKLKEIEGF